MSTVMFLGEALSVTVKQGDITDEDTEAIVNVNNATLDRNHGVSKRVIAVAGPTVREECARLKNTPSDGYVVTGPGNLKSKILIHLIKVNFSNIESCVINCLKVCELHNLKSLCLPALGTGAASVDAQSSIKAIMRAIENYTTDPTVETSIATIHIVVFNPPVYQEYLTFLQKYRSNYSDFTAFGKSVELIKGDITDQAMDCIVNLANCTLNRTAGVSGSILTAAGDTVKEECKHIGVLKKGEAAITNGGKLKAKKIMHVRGTHAVSGFEPMIDLILKMCHNHHFKSVAIPAIGTGAARIDSSKSIKAILKSILSYLSHTAIPTLETISITVIEEKIYQTYLKIFLEKSTELQIIRIQNKKLWQSFFLKKQAVDRKNPGQLNVKHLYHGTSADRIHNISHEGFNRTYCGDHVNNKYQHYQASGTSLGKGTYFAVNSNYSCRDVYAAPDSMGLKYIYQAAVITGRFCVGDKTMKEPPYISNDPSEGRYDSVANSLQNPSYFSVFRDDCSYPEYIITFKFLK
ncbi:protein mono-ADP-ribosyltransferase PARP15-like [Gastrophryne carolinensis]